MDVDRVDRETGRHDTAWIVRQADGFSDVEVIIWQRIARGKNFYLQTPGKAWFYLINLFIDLNFKSELLQVRKSITQVLLRGQH